MYISHDSGICWLLHGAGKEFIPLQLLYVGGVCLFFHFSQKHWTLAAAMAGEFNQGALMLLLGLKPKINLKLILG